MVISFLVIYFHYFTVNESATVTTLGTYRLHNWCAAKYAFNMC